MFETFQTCFYTPPILSHCGRLRFFHHLYIKTFNIWICFFFFSSKLFRYKTMWLPIHYINMKEKKILQTQLKLDIFFHRFKMNLSVCRCTRFYVFYFFFLFFLLIFSSYFFFLFFLILNRNYLCTFLFLGAELLNESLYLQVSK